MTSSVLFMLLIAIIVNGLDSFSTFNNRVHSGLQTPLRYCNKKLCTRHNLQMHLGHHHDHDHQHGSELSLFSQLSNPKQFFKKPEGKVIVITSALMLLSVFIKKKLTRWDLIIFGGLTTALSVFRTARTIMKSWISRIKLFKDGVVRHSRPINLNPFMKNSNAADRVTLLGVAVNVVLSGIKFFGGIAFNSAVLIADAGHSLSDLFSDFITLWAVQISRLPPDSDHPYGHGKFESVGSLFLALTLIATGLSVGSWSYQKMLCVLTTSTAASSSPLASIAAPSIASSVTVVAHAGHGVISGTSATPSLPTWPALLTALVSILSKEWLFQITKRVGDSLNSQILIANAWHHRSDMFSSVLSLFSIAAAMFLPGFLIADSAAGILIASMISLTGIEVLNESVKQLTDQSDEVLADEIVAMVSNDVEGVEGVCTVRARRVGSGSLVDMSVLTQPKLSTSAAQEIAERTRWQVMEAFPSVLDMAVRTQGTGKICPLLSRNQRSIIDVEAHVRKTLETNFGNNEMFSAIKRVTVHYVNAAALCVDVHLYIKRGDYSVSEVRQLAQRMRSQLLEGKDIIQAEVLLDLTEEEESPDGNDAVVQYMQEIK